MARERHPWHHASKQVGRRLALGLTLSLSMALVAFEWNSSTVPPAIIDSDIPDDLLEDDKTIPHPIIDRGEPEPVVKEKREGADRIEVMENTTVVPTEKGPVEDERGDEGPALTDLGELMGMDSAAVDGGKGGTGDFDPNAEVLPYFMDCLKEDPGHRDECTTERMLGHIQRHFKVPPGIRESIRTTVTFRVEDDGTIGRVVCAPRVAASVQREVERVLRRMPELVPGSQGGIPVGVYYQLPLRISVR